MDLSHIYNLVTIVWLIDFIIIVSDYSLWYKFWLIELLQFKEFDHPHQLFKINIYFKYILYCYKTDLHYFKNCYHKKINDMRENDLLFIDFIFGSLNPHLIVSFWILFNLSFYKIIKGNSSCFPYHSCRHLNRIINFIIKTDHQFYQSGNSI